MTATRHRPRTRSATRRALVIGAATVDVTATDAPKNGWTGPTCGAIVETRRTEVGHG